MIEKIGIPASAVHQTKPRSRRASTARQSANDLLAFPVGPKPVACHDVESELRRPAAVRVQICAVHSPVTYFPKNVYRELRNEPTARLRSRGALNPLPSPVTAHWSSSVRTWAHANLLSPLTSWASRKLRNEPTCNRHRPVTGSMGFPLSPPICPASLCIVRIHCWKWRWNRSGGSGGPMDRVGAIRRRTRRRRHGCRKAARRRLSRVYRWRQSYA